MATLIDVVLYGISLYGLYRKMQTQPSLAPATTPPPTLQPDPFVQPRFGAEDTGHEGIAFDPTMPYAGGESWDDRLVFAPAVCSPVTPCPDEAESRFDDIASGPISGVNPDGTMWVVAAGSTPSYTIAPAAPTPVTTSPTVVAGALQPPAEATDLGYEYANNSSNWQVG